MMCPRYATVDCPAFQSLEFQLVTMHDLKHRDQMCKVGLEVWTIDENIVEENQDKLL